jgi:hypothetical protein
MSRPPSDFGTLKRLLKIGPWRINSLGSSATNLVDAKFCIFNLRSISQAGRRGFESRLPLHLFNHLRPLCFKSCSKMLQLVHHGAFECIDCLFPPL